MDIPDLYKRRINFHPKEGDGNKPVPKTNATSIVTSARESLKHLQVPKTYFPPQRKISHNKNSVAKFHSPLTPETKDLFFTEDLSVPRVNSAFAGVATPKDNFIMLDEMDKLHIQRRVTVDTDNQQARLNKNDTKPLLNNQAKSSSKVFIIKHKRGNSIEMRKASFSSTQASEISKDVLLSSPSKPSTAEENIPVESIRTTPEHIPVETITEERKSECSSFSSNKPGIIENANDNNAGESSIYTMKFEESGEKKGELSSEIELLGSKEIKRKPQKSNTILKKEGLASFDVKLGELIGEGAYGRVYKALNTETGKFLAVKEISMEETEPKPSLNVGTLCQEIEVYQKLEHEHIVRYLGAKQEAGDTYIYMEYMPGGSISSMLKQYGFFEEKVIRKFAKQVALGLSYLHGKGVVHRDIKGGNILSDGAGNVKLADFGAAKHIDYLPFVASVSSSEVCNSIKGSLFWMAPELINQKKHGRKIDIWSFGCTIIEMATARHPWSNVKNYTELVIAMMNQKCPPIPEHLSDCAKDFIRQCCQFDKKLRPRIEELLNHPFLKYSEIN